MDNGTGTITGSKTGLMWEKKESLDGREPGGDEGPRRLQARVRQLPEGERSILNGVAVLKAFGRSLDQMGMVCSRISVASRL